MNNITVCARPDPTLVIKINNKYVNLYTVLDLLNYDHNDFERLIYDSDVEIQDQKIKNFVEIFIKLCPRLSDIEKEMSYIQNKKVDNNIENNNNTQNNNLIKTENNNSIQSIIDNNNTTIRNNLTLYVVENVSDYLNFKNRIKYRLQNINLAKFQGRTLWYVANIIINSNSEFSSNNDIDRRNVLIYNCCNCFIQLASENIIKLSNDNCRFKFLSQYINNDPLPMCVMHDEVVLVWEKFKDEFVKMTNFNKLVNYISNSYSEISNFDLNPRKRIACEFVNNFISIGYI